ncbi:diacylglycerol kinase [Candidatus Haliotispira prima]|uniref:Diacylglycerol kinase n=1 Tax=Candidatus Haliotispira prima TaxID=3034016 RepID=A0ABY8MFG0_9SPIO|nr:diacylglycerol kinase [Candidatus Haliotispira prima]
MTTVPNQEPEKSQEPIKPSESREPRKPEEPQKQKSPPKLQREGGPEDEISSSKAYQYHRNLAANLKRDHEPDFHEIDKRHRHSPFASFRWAFRGLYYAFRTQRNFRIELFLALCATVLGLILGISREQWSIILFSISQVLGAELANTALEYMVDLYERKFNDLAMMAKDIAAAFVLLSAIHASVQGILVFAPYIFRYLRLWS